MVLSRGWWEEASPSNPVGSYIVTRINPGHSDSGAHNSRSMKESERGTHPPEGRQTQMWRACVCVRGCLRVQGERVSASPALSLSLYFSGIL